MELVRILQHRRTRGFMTWQQDWAAALLLCPRLLGLHDTAWQPEVSESRELRCQVHSPLALATPLLLSGGVRNQSMPGCRLTQAAAASQ